MKKLLLLALSVVAIVSCKRTVETNGQTPDPAVSSDVIQLSVGGGGVAITMAEGDPVANAGVRKFFIAGDQIAIYAAYTKAGTDAGSFIPDWYGTGEPKADSAAQVGSYFRNIAAMCTTPGSIDATDNSHTSAIFTWGATGLGGVDVDRIYPRNNKGLFIYGYYPFSESDTVKQEAEADLSQGPKLNITLKTLADISGDNPHAQPDILFTKGVAKTKIPAVAGDTIVCRQNPLDSLVFKHALAQLNFKVQRNEGAAKALLRKIEFSTPKSGVMTIMNGKITVADPSTDDEWINYVITNQAGEEIPIVTATNSVDPLTVLAANPLMIFPLDVDQAKKCKLKLTVYYGTSSDPDTDLKNNKTFIIDLNNSAMKAFLQGRKNTLTMQMSETQIYLKASIDPWVDNAEGDNSIIPVE